VFTHVAGDVVTSRSTVAALPMQASYPTLYFPEAYLLFGGYKVRASRTRHTHSCGITRWDTYSRIVL